MKPLYYLLTMALFATTLVPRPALAWDGVYDGSMMPNDPDLGTNVWFDAYTGNDVSSCSTDGSILHLVDQRTDATALFSKFAVPWQSPVTVEARVRVTAGEGAALVAGTPSFAAGLLLYPDRVDVYLSPGSPVSYETDLTQFRTIRIAMSSLGRSYIWLDGALLAQGVTTSTNQGDVAFGSISASGLNDSYWDYVAYSNAFVPVPEPSSLLALGIGGIGIFGMALRRRRLR